MNAGERVNLRCEGGIAIKCKEAAEEVSEMKNFRGTLVKASLTLFGLCAVFAAPLPAQAPVDAGRKPVIVELFTSEGCSDCPPAEAFARKLEEQPIAGADVIVLEEHVDYWNKYGWFDPFSSPDWTTRQLDYVGRGNPYTPEMVVDGQSQFPGGEVQRAEQDIESAAGSPDTDVTIADVTRDPKESEDFKVSAGKLEGSAAGDIADVWIAVTEDGLHSSVNAGENAGHVLYHAAVLRYLHKIGVAQAGGGAAFTGSARIKFKSNWNRKDVNVVAFVQDRKSHRILGAASMRLAS